MEEKTMNDVFHKLRPKQLDYIVWCVKMFGNNRKNFHRGLLPFLPKDEALRSLKFRLEFFPIGLGPEEPQTGVKFLRQLISTIGENAPYQLYPDEVTHEIFLRDDKLHTEFGRRFAKKFCTMCGASSAIEGMVQLEWIRKNWWKITTKSNQMECAKQWLSDCFSS